MKDKTQIDDPGRRLAELMDGIGELRRHDDLTDEQKGTLDAAKSALALVYETYRHADRLEARRADGTTDEDADD